MFHSLLWESGKQTFSQPSLVEGKHDNEQITINVPLQSVPCDRKYNLFINWPLFVRWTPFEVLPDPALLAKVKDFQRHFNNKEWSITKWKGQYSKIVFSCSNSVVNSLFGTTSDPTPSQRLSTTSLLRHGTALNSKAKLRLLSPLSETHSYKVSPGLGKGGGCWLRLGEGLAYVTRLALA